MARKPRKYGSSGIYHIVLRGNNQQNIFYDNEDRLYFLKKLNKYISETTIDLFAYCLMDNHVHLLIGKGNDRMPLFIKKLLCSYVYFFNHKYKRTGHLFQGRYKSEPVDNPEYFKTVYRYILQNPEKAHICNFKDYLWSSYQQLEKKDSCLNKIFSYAVFETKEKLIQFLNLTNNDVCMDFFDFKVSCDELISEFIKHALNICNPTQIASMPENEMKTNLLFLKRSNIPINQIARLTSINKRIIKLA